MERAMQCPSISISGMYELKKKSRFAVSENWVCGIRGLALDVLYVILKVLR